MSRADSCKLRRSSVKNECVHFVWFLSSACNSSSKSLIAFANSCLSAIWDVTSAVAFRCKRRPALRISMLSSDNGQYVQIGLAETQGYDSAESFTRKSICCFTFEVFKAYLSQPCCGWLHTRQPHSVNCCCNLSTIVVGSEVHEDTVEIDSL